MAAKFLEVICDKMDGLIDIVGKISLEIIQYELAKDQV